MMKDKKVLGGVGLLLIAAFWFYIKPNYLDAKPPVVYTEEQIADAPRPTLFIGKNVDPHAKEQGEKGVVFNLKAPVTNPNYAKVVMAIEFEDPEHEYVGLSTPDAIIAANVEYAHHLSPDMHKILDVISRTFAAKTIDQIGTPEGKEKLKAELISALNTELHHAKVEAIYFESFITQ